MDPEANLTEQRELAATLLFRVENDRRISPSDVHRLAELVIALDTWICSGGHNPRDWTPTKQHNMASEGIRIWAFTHAPNHYKQLSDNGGDEDGIILVPAGMEEPHWLESIYRYDHQPQRFEREEGLVIIWAHA